MGSRATEKLRENFDKTLDSGPRYNGSLEDMDYYAMMCKAASGEAFFKMKGSNVSMFNLEYDDTDAVMVLFSVPMHVGEGGKHISERVMDIVKAVEECFTTVDFTHSREVKEDKFVYLTFIKKLEK